MDVPISLALILATTMSLAETTNHGEHVYFDSAVMLMFFLLIGRYLDFLARKKARSAATDLLSTLSGFATVIDGQKIHKILIRDVQAGMKVRVMAGEKFPVDGVVMDGQSEVDTSLVTGETIPRDIKKGIEVFAGTLNLSAPVTIKVAKAAQNSLLADIVRLMDKAGQGQAKYVRLADKAAKLYTPVVHTLAALAFLGWWLIGGMEWQNALVIAITVLIITCPCALGLAVPVVQVLASGQLMKKGILVKSGDALERLAKIDMILFDKTGTLTLGKPDLEGKYDRDILQIAASIASHSTHPLSKALLLHYDGDLLSIQDVKEYPGKGLEGKYKDKITRLGSRKWCGLESVPSSEEIELWLHIEGESPLPFYFMDHLREDAAHTIARFQTMGVVPVMLSGDRQFVVDKTSDQLGIEYAYAEKTPPEKYQILEDVKRRVTAYLWLEMV